MIFLPLSIQIAWVCVPNRYSAQPFIIWEKTTETTGFAMYSDANRTNIKKQAKLKSLETFYSQNCLNTWLTIPSTWHPGADVTVTTGKVITRDIKRTHHDPVLLCRSNKRDECMSHVCEFVCVKQPDYHCLAPTVVRTTDVRSSVYSGSPSAQLCMIQRQLVHPMFLCYCLILMSVQIVQNQNVNSFWECFLWASEDLSIRWLLACRGLFLMVTFSPVLWYRLKPTFQLPIKAGMFFTPLLLRALLCLKNLRLKRKNAVYLGNACVPPQIMVYSADWYCAQTKKLRHCIFDLEWTLIKPSWYNANEGGKEIKASCPCCGAAGLVWSQPGSVCVFLSPLSRLQQGFSSPEVTMASFLAEIWKEQEILWLSSERWLYYWDTANKDWCRPGIPRLALSLFFPSPWSLLLQLSLSFRDRLQYLELVRKHIHLQQRTQQNK